MSDSFNSPNQLSLEKSQELTPELNVTAVEAQQADYASALEDFEDDFDDLEAIASPDSESNIEEEVSFEVIADYIEAEVAATPSMSFPSHTDLKTEEEEIPESLTAVENAFLGEVGEVSFDSEDASDDTAETVQEAFTDLARDLDEDRVETATEEGEEITESFDASAEVVDVEILESQEQERSYEVHQDGTLTYFQYFLDEEDSVFGPGHSDWRDETHSSPRSFVSATAVGVGVLAATFGAGLLMAEATNRNSISDRQAEGSETQAKADAERNAGEASGLAKASGPETNMPDWSASQKAIAISQGSDQASPTLGSAAAMLKSKTSPAGSSVTSKLAPLTQSWGTSVTRPAPTLPIASTPVVTMASLPTPTTVPVALSALKPVPSYQVIQRSSGTASAPLPSSPANATFQQNEQQLRARMDALRDRMADPITSSSVPTTTDGNLLDGPDERWVSNVPRRLDVPLNENGTTVGNAFPSAELPSLTDSPYGSPAMTNSSAVMPPSAASISATAPRPIAAAPQTYPLDLSPVAPPHQASSLDKQVVAPVAGLLPTPVAPKPSEPLPPRASVEPPHAVEQQVAAQTSSPAPVATAPQALAPLKVTPGAIALEVIPPAVSTPVLTPGENRPAATGLAAVTQTSTSIEQSSTPAAEVAMLPQGIKSLTELTSIQSPRPLALSRDTARAALAHAEKLVQFRVLPLTVGEYQLLWQESGNDGTFAPIHGFVDYGKNVIAVVVPRGEVTAAGSATASAMASAMAKDTNLQRTGDVTATATPPFQLGQ